MILRVPNFPPLNSEGKPPTPLVLLLGQGDWQMKAATDINRSSGCIVCTDGVLPDKRTPPAVWIETVMQYVDAVDAIGIWVPIAGLYLDEWSVAAYFIGHRPQVVICGSHPDPTHPMSPGFVHLAQQAGVSVFSDSAQFIAALRNCVRTSR